MFEFIVIPIISGTLKGKLWIVGCSGKMLFRFITTTYETTLTHLFEKHVKTGDIVYDIGANTGYFTLLSSVLVGNGGKVYAFEPAKKVFKLLKKHIKINRYKNVDIFNKAISDKNGVGFFDTGDGIWTGKISTKGEYEVEIVKLDDFVLKNNISLPNIIKIDVEGEELNVLKGAKNLLTECSPLIFLSAHSQQLYDSCCEFLKSLGYEIKSIQQMRDLIIAFKNRKNEKI